MAKLLGLSHLLYGSGESLEQSSPPLSLRGKELGSDYIQRNKTKFIIKLSPLNIGRGLLFCALNNALLKLPFFHRSIANHPAREIDLREN
jgi:hypothetical protein